MGCGILHFLPQIDCSVAFSCQTTASFYLGGSHISLLGKIIHGDIKQACGGNEITYVGNSNSLLFLQQTRGHMKSMHYSLFSERMTNINKKSQNKQARK